MPLLRVNEVGEFVGIAHEEDRRVVADHIPIALLGIEFEGKAAHIAFMIGGANLAGDRREPGARLPLLAARRKNAGLGGPRGGLRHRKGAKRAPAFVTHAAPAVGRTLLWREP